MAQRSIRIAGTGAVDLFRLDASGTQNITWSLPAITLQGGILRFRNNNAATYNHSMAADLHVATGGAVIENNGGTGVQSITLSGSLTGSDALVYAADATGSTRQLSITSSNNPFGGNWSVFHAGSGTAILRAAAANALGTGTVTVGNGGQLLNDHVSGLDSLAGVALGGENAALKLNQPWNKPTASLAMNAGTSVAEVGNAESTIGNLSGVAGASLRGTGAASTLTVNQTTDQWFGGTVGPDLHLIKSGPAGLTLAGALNESLKLTTTQGRLTLAGEPEIITSVTQTGGELALKLSDETTPPLTLTGDYLHTAGVLRVNLPVTGFVTGVPYPLVAYAGVLTGQPPVEFTEPAPFIMNYGSGSNSMITVTFYEAALLITVASPPEGGTVSEGGFHHPGSHTVVTATPTAGWQFYGWQGDGVLDVGNPVASILMDESKTVTAYFITDFEAWTRSYGLSDDDALPGADPDGDGMINDLEFRLGFDPNDRNSTLRLSIRRSGSGDLILKINRVIAEGTFTLETASSPAGPWDGEIPVAVIAPEWDHEVTLPVAGNIGFFRLRYVP
jgi:hypothetical protein